MEINTNQEPNEINYNKIGGALFIFPILFILLTIYFLAHFKRDVRPNLVNMNLLIDVKPEFLPVILFQVLSMVILFVLLTLSVIFFIRRSIKFPVLMIILLGYYSIFLIVDYFWYNEVAEYANEKIAENFNAPYRKLIYRSIALGLIFIPYLIKSKRVKKTFIKKTLKDAQ